MTLDITLDADVIRTPVGDVSYSEEAFTLPADSDAYFYFNFAINRVVMAAVPTGDDEPRYDPDFLLPIAKYTTDSSDVTATVDRRVTAPVSPENVFAEASIPLSLLGTLERTDVADDGLYLIAPVASTGSAFKANANWALALEAPNVPIEVGDIECEDILPTNDAANDIGSSTYRWRSVRAQQILAGDLLLDSVNMDPSLPRARWRLKEDPQGIKVIDEISGTEYWMELRRIETWQETASKVASTISGKLTSTIKRACVAGLRSLIRKIL